MDEVCLPWLTCPILHLLQILLCRLSDYHEETLDTLVIELANQLFSLECKRRLAIGDDQQGALCILPSCCSIHHLGQCKCLSHVCEPLLVRQIFKSCLHQREIICQWLLVDGGRYVPGRHDNSVTELDHSHFHGLCTKIFAVVLAEKVDGERLK